MTEHEYLLHLRELAEKQQQELDRKDQTIEVQKAQIEKQRIRIENMIQRLSHVQKKLFGHPHKFQNMWMVTFCCLIQRRN